MSCRMHRVPMVPTLVASGPTAWSALRRALGGRHGSGVRFLGRPAVRLGRTGLGAGPEAGLGAELGRPGLGAGFGAGLGRPSLGSAGLAIAGLTALSLLLVACEVPNFQGPQVQSPPDGYVPRRDLPQEHRMFPELPVTYHDAWIDGSIQEAGSIHINGHHGFLGADAVQTARDDALALPSEGLLVGGLDRLVVDERQAWGWSERRASPDGSVQWAAYRMAVAYDTVTYTIEFETSEPEMTARPDSIRAIVASFAVGQTTWNLPALAVLAGALLLGLGALRTRAERRAEHLRTITLAKVPKGAERAPGGGVAGGGGDVGEVARDGGVGGVGGGSGSGGGIGKG